MAKRSRDDGRRVGDLLVTKLEIPLLGFRIVRRERLTALLHEDIEQRVTLIVAPAGYGKTTLLGEWLSTLPATEYRSAWVTLNSFDNTPLRFWSYVTAAVRKACPQLHFRSEYMLQQGYDPLDFTRLIPLFNEIAQIPSKVCLILDDYQTITDENVQRGVAYLIDHQPRNLHLILVSRVTPPLALSRLRAQRRLIEVTAGDLAFTLQETKTFLFNVMKLDVDAQQAAELLDSTEGWIAGLQMAALSLKGRQGRQPVGAHFLGDHWEILDYLTEEVLNQLDERTQNFLLKTSILAELSAPLCDVLLERNDSEDMLAKIERAKLFIAPLDDGHAWYRYHPLFADALALQLKRRDPDAFPRLHSRACAWLLEHGYPDKAIAHALAIGDLEKAAEIIETCALQAVIDFDVARLVHWIDSISEDLIHRRPRLGIYYALANYFLGRMDLVEQKLRMAEQALAGTRGNAISAEEEASLRWEIGAIRASAECLSGDYTQGILHATALLKEVPKKGEYVSGSMLHALAEAYDAIGDLPAAVDAFQQGREIASEQNFPFGFVHSTCRLARIYKLQGRLNAARQEYKRALDFALQSGVDVAAIALAQTGLMDITREQNDLETAGRLAQDVMGNFDQVELSASGRIMYVLRCVLLVRYCLCVRDFDGARFYFEKVLDNYHDMMAATPNPLPEIIDIQVRIRLAFERDEPMESWIEEGEVAPHPGAKPGLPEQVARARMYLAHGRPEEALPILSDLERAAEKAGQGERRLEALVLQSLAYRAAQRREPALEAIDRAVRLAEPEGYVQVFVDEGEPMRALLVDTLSAWQEQGAGKMDGRNYLTKLIAAFERGQGAPDRPVWQAGPGVTAISPLQEPLSPREIEVLGLLAAGNSIKEVAESLMISMNTAKTHVKNVYRKLDAHTRKAIVQRADELGVPSLPSR